jgi:hypothetical protein
VRAPRSQPPAYEEQDDAAGPAGGLEIHRLEVELGRPLELEIVPVTGPGCPDPDARQDLQDPVDLLDLGNPAKHRTTTVEQARTEQADRCVLRGSDLDAPVQLGAALHSQVLRPACADRDDGGVQGLRDPSHHLQAEVLVAGLDPMNGALAGPEHLRELGLRQPPMLACITDQAPDPVQIGISHDRQRYVIGEIFCETSANSPAQSVGSMLAGQLPILVVLPA